MKNNNKEMWLWLIQRISAFLIFFAIIVHIWNVHYADFGGEITFASVTMRLKNVIIYFTDSSLLLLGLFHGLNGIRTVLLDFISLNKYEKIISRFLIIIGIVFFFIGARGLWQFIIIR